MNIFLQFIKSFYAIKEIALFRFQGIGKTILYIFVMVAIVSIPSAFNTSFTIINGIKSMQLLMEEAPHFQFENGMLRSELAQPYVNEREDRVIIFDSSGTLQRDDIANHENTFALLEREAILATNGDVQVLRYQDLGNLTVTKEQIANIINGVAGLLPLFISLFLLLAYGAIATLKFIEVSFLALIGLLFTRKRPSLKYRHLWFLSPYAITLPTTLLSIVEMLRMNLPFTFLLFWFIAITFLYVIIQKVPLPKKRVVTNKKEGQTEY